MTFTPFLYFSDNKTDYTNHVALDDILLSNYMTLHDMLVKVIPVKDIGFILFKKPDNASGYNYRNTVNTLWCKLVLKCTSR